MTAALAVSETVVDYPLADILDPTIKNYRTNFRGIEELEASVRESGIRVPLVLRPSPTQTGMHELAIGARRREAATRAGLETVPVIIRELSDEEVHTERCLENLQRVDPDPVDEAEAFQRMTGLGWSVAQVAAKIGKPPRYVLERLQLCNLCPEGREALDRGTLLIGAAIEIAKLSGSLQARALEEIDGSQAWRGGLATAADAREAISNRVMLELGNAPFKLDDAELVPAAGPCTTCTKRTGGQAELFADFATDLCTDSVCHKGKLDALWQLRTKQAKAEGVEVLSKKAAAEALRSTAASYGSGPFVRLDEKVHLGSHKPKSLKSAFGADLPPITLARDEESGAPVELVPRKAVEKLLNASKPAAAGPSKGADAKAKAEREKEQLQAEVRRRVLLALVAGMTAASPATVSGKQVLQVLTLAAVHSLPPDVAKAVANRRGCPLALEEGAATDKKGKGKRQQQLTPEQRLRLLVDTLDGPQLGGLLIELLLHRAAPGKWSEAHESYDAATMLFSVDVEAIEQAVRSERKAKTEGKTQKPAAAALVHHLAVGKKNASACGKAEVGSKSTSDTKSVTCPACLKLAAVASAERAARPQHPAKGKPVHYIDPTGISQTGLACGTDAADGKGVISDEPSKVTCKNCRRTAGLDDAVGAPAPGDD